MTEKIIEEQNLEREVKKNEKEINVREQPEVIIDYPTGRSYVKVAHAGELYLRGFLT